MPLDATIENSIASDPYATILVAHDPLFGNCYSINRQRLNFAFLIDYDSPFSDLTNTPFFLTSSIPNHIPTIETITSERIIQKK